MIKYRTRFNKIEAIEVERETEKQVLLPANNGSRAYRENKRSDWSNWHDTFEGARDFLLNNNEIEAKRLKERIKRLEEDCAKIKKMTDGE